MTQRYTIDEIVHDYALWGGYVDSMATMTEE